MQIEDTVHLDVGNAVIVVEVSAWPNLGEDSEWDDVDEADHGVVEAVQTVTEHLHDVEERGDEKDDETTYVPLTSSSGLTRHLEEESLVVVEDWGYYVGYADGYDEDGVQPWVADEDEPREYGWVFEEAPIDVEDYLINVGGVDYELKEKIEYVETLSGRGDTVEPAPERSEGEILVGFDKKDGLRDISSRNLQVLDKDGVEFKYVGWDDHGYDVYLLLDVYLDERETMEAGPRYTATD